jgi:hypothetical protein
MNETAIIFACSHRPGGNSDHAARLIAQGVEEAGGAARIVAVRDFEITHCTACHACLAAPDHRCIFQDQDQAEELFALLRQAPAVFFASPIYFYHLPSRLKAWIDRGQRFWAMRQDQDPAVPHGADHPAMGAAPLPSPRPDSRPIPRLAHVALFAGRPRGEKLFEGALVTLKFFLSNFGIGLAEPLLFRGKDGPGDLAADAAAEGALAGMGRRGWL